MSPGRSPLWAIARYEFLMQIRRKSLWIAFGAVTIFLFALFDRSFTTEPTAARRVNSLVQLKPVFIIIPIVVGFFLADRLARDRQLLTSELIGISPAGPRSYVWGKFIGSAGATALAALASMLLLSLAFGALGSLQGVGRLVLGFLLLAVPSYLFVGAFSIACPAILPVRLYQVLFTGYWLWTQQQLIPSPRGTPFDPNGPYSVPMIVPNFSDTVSGPLGWVFRATPLLAGLNLVLILGLAALALIGLERYLIWREAQS